MKYEISEKIDKKESEEFIAENKPHTFLQSWSWVECYAASGNKVLRLALIQKKEIIAIFMLIKFSAKRGAYLLCPHGPIIKKSLDTKKILPQILSTIAEYGQSEKCDFVRVCPAIADGKEIYDIFKKAGFKNSPIHTHPELAWVLDVTKSENDLLAQMRKTTRYLIRRAEKEGVVIEQSDRLEDISRFWSIYNSTAERQGFVPFRKQFLKEEFEIFSKDNNIKLFFGKYNDEIVVAAMIVFYGDSGFYHHSGSLKKHEKIGVSHLLQWEAIKETKKRGLSFYNFWGISPEDKPNHPWAGLSLFKKGFGGFSEPYVKSQDKPLTKKYYLNYMVEKIRSLKRGYN